MKSEKTDYAYLLTRATKSAGSILNDTKKLNRLVDTATLSIDSGVSRMKSVKSDMAALLSLIKAWARGDYKGASKTTLLLSVGAIVYFLNPMDAIPDILPATGLLDDATVVGIVITSVKNDIEKFKRWETGASDIPQDIEPEPLAS